MAAGQTDFGSVQHALAKRLLQGGSSTAASFDQTKPSTTASPSPGQNAGYTTGDDTNPPPMPSTPPPPGSDSNSIYNALVSLAQKWHPGETWTDTYGDQLKAEINAAIGTWGAGTVSGVVNGSWPAYAMQIAKYGLGLGPAVLNRHDPTHAGIVHVPGYGAGGEVEVPADVRGLWTDPSTGKQYYVY